MVWCSVFCIEDPMNHLKMMFLCSVFCMEDWKKHLKIVMFSVFSVENPTNHLRCSVFCVEDPTNHFKTVTFWFSAFLCQRTKESLQDIDIPMFCFLCLIFMESLQDRVSLLNLNLSPLVYFRTEVRSTLLMLYWGTSVTFYALIVIHWIY
jgi:hypothetical protein